MRNILAVVSTGVFSMLLSSAAFAAEPAPSAPAQQTQPAPQAKGHKHMNGGKKSSTTGSHAQRAKSRTQKAPH